MKRIGVVAKTDREDAARVIHSILDWCGQRDLTVVLEKETAALTPDRQTVAVLKPELPSQVDLILVLGGSEYLPAVSLGRRAVDLRRAAPRRPRPRRRRAGGGAGRARRGVGLGRRRRRAARARPALPRPGQPGQASARA